MTSLIAVVLLFLCYGFFNPIQTSDTYTVDGGSCNFLSNPNICKQSCNSISQNNSQLANSICNLLTSKCVCYFQNKTTATTKIPPVKSTKQLSAHVSERPSPLLALTQTIMTSRKWLTTNSFTPTFTATSPGSQNSNSTTGFPNLSTLRLNPSTVFTFDTTSQTIQSDSQATSTISAYFTSTLQLITTMFTSGSTILSSQQNIISISQSVQPEQTTVYNEITNSSSMQTEDKIITRTLPPIQNNVAIVGGLAVSFVGVIVTSLVICKTVPFCQGPTMFEFVPTII